MVTEIEEDLEFVCYDCIGDAYLKEEIKAEGNYQVCIICSNSQGSIAFNSLGERVHQVVSEEFDGTGENVVLFRGATTVEPDNPDNMEFDTDFGWVSEDDEDLDITVWLKAKKPSENPDRAHQSWAGDGPRATLRVDFETLEVRDIKAGGVPHPDARCAPVQAF
jgi:hypothetical protein